MRLHETDVRYQRAYAEWLPVCSCGWVGSYLKLRASAEREAAEHEENADV